MHTRAVPFALLAAALAGCAAHRPPEEIGDNPREVDVIAPPGAERIPLYSAHGVPGCRIRSAGELVSPSLLGLRDQAHQKMADAVMDVRQQVQVNPRPTRQTFEVVPIGTIYYTGTAVRFDDAECRSAQSRKGLLEVEP